MVYLVMKLGAKWCGNTENEELNSGQEDCRRCHRSVIGIAIASNQAFQERWLAIVVTWAVLLCLLFLGQLFPTLSGLPAGIASSRKSPFTLSSSQPRLLYILLLLPWHLCTPVITLCLLSEDIESNGPSIHPIFPTLCWVTREWLFVPHEIEL